MLHFICNWNAFKTRVATMARANLHQFEAPFAMCLDHPHSHQKMPCSFFDNEGKGHSLHPRWNCKEGDCCTPNTKAVKCLVQDFVRTERSFQCCVTDCQVLECLLQEHHVIFQKMTVANTQRSSAKLCIAVCTDGLNGTITIMVVTRETF